ncbi:MAG: hypothetical protein AB1331_03385 [Bacillota bacterium]
MGDRGQTRLAWFSLSGEGQLVFPAEDRLCTIGPLDAAGGRLVVGIDRPETALELYVLPASDLGEADMVRYPVPGQSGLPGVAGQLPGLYFLRGALLRSDPGRLGAP